MALRENQQNARVAGASSDEHFSGNNSGGGEELGYRNRHNCKLFLHLQFCTKSFILQFDACEPRILGWLINLLFQLVKKPSENSAHIKTYVKVQIIRPNKCFRRLYLLHCGLSQVLLFSEYINKKIVDRNIKVIRILGRMASPQGMETIGGTLLGTN